MCHLMAKVLFLFLLRCWHLPLDAQSIVPYPSQMLISAIWCPKYCSFALSDADICLLMPKALIQRINGNSVERAIQGERRGNQAIRLDQKIATCFNNEVNWYYLVIVFFPIKPIWASKQMSILSTLLGIFTLPGHQLNFQRNLRECSFQVTKKRYEKRTSLPLLTCVTPQHHNSETYNVISLMKLVIHCFLCSHR